MRAPWLGLMALVACGGGGDEDSTPTSGTASGSPTLSGCVATDVQPEVITLTTRDGVDLEADRYTGVSGAPAVALFHMIPPSATRADYPDNFIARLTCHGWSVINVDRRGAGGSSGTPVDSYEGPGGAFDVEAAVNALADVGGTGPLGVLGASNGTTSALDYAVLAEAEGLTVPTAMGFLTGGTYTENQNDVADLPASVTLGLYSSVSESAWTEDQREHDPGDWTFVAYPGGGHGTQLFNTEGPTVRDDLEAFFLAELGM